MCGRSSDKDSGRVGEALLSAGSMLLATHVSPDGDAIGSMAALVRAASAAGKSARAVVPVELPQRYEFMLAGLDTVPEGAFARAARSVDSIVVVDTCSFAQLAPIAEELRRLSVKTVVIDHHATSDDIGSIQWQDSSASAAGVMVGELLDELDWPVTPAIADALATAILTDTGWLRFSNTDNRSLDMLGVMLSRGANFAKLHRLVYENNRPERIKLRARALASLELHCEGRLAMMTLRAKDFSATGADQSETEDLVNEAMSIRGVEVAVMLTELADQVRASLRSHPSQMKGTTGVAVDVARIARRFGGGGHVQAAGCRSTDDLEVFCRKLLLACQDSM